MEQDSGCGLERDRFIDAAFRDDLRRLNSHLPKSRRTLEDLLRDEFPSVPSISGHVIRMKKQELIDLGSSLQDLDKSRVLLPIILLRRRDLGPGAFMILGDVYEEYVVSHLSGAFSGTFEGFRKLGTDAVSIYKPQVASLLRRFHSLIAVGFGTIGSKATDPAA